MSGRIAIVGNFGPEHSTENHLARAWAANGWAVTPVQENDPHAWAELVAAPGDHDLISWTRTASLCPPTEDQHRLFDAASEAATPVIGWHLDRWWGLAREHELATTPYFTRTDVLFTADGGHDDRWDEIGATHVWLPPAVSAAECIAGTAREHFTSPVVFVGSWRSGYHPEWRHRADLVRHLRRRGDVTFWPQRDQPAVRGRDLRDLYASVAVAVGDSCLVPRTDGTPAQRYWSDRVPETMGRGCVLVHPWVEGLEDEHPHVATWPLGDWAALDSLIDSLLGDPFGTAELAAEAKAHTLALHTYEVRVTEVVNVLKAKGLL